ncbi:glycosyltransferase [Algibacter pectinivorans]|uniref:Glycosyltransferase involved in cell wall bisynthesis n=1 Tax=Algibacter pectinivorans TaxID=870482 RepID=A0A1I1P007_9FLAO|nr:glycosyltransferase [Algibacter pectinivorans]SFD02922.1 Glycosyltransferase involved in cell wall bisynthesis [Algibacter pectinivorans]
MRVLQLIDSLETGGAERVAVNIANALSSNIEYAALCATRKEGLLKQDILNTVDYLFLEKKRAFDIQAINKLSRFIRTNNIQIIHAHSSSFFLATIIKILNLRVKVIWHDHYGNSEFLNQRKHVVLKGCSKFFSHVFSVNKNLQTWAIQKLKHAHVSYQPNFATLNKSLQETILKGVANKRIVCLANLRPQKDHITLIKAFNKVNVKYPDWSLHCVGKSFNDEYSKSVHDTIMEFNLESSVYLYNAKLDIYNILTQCEIGVLSSISEGLPIGLLEYGLSSLAVIATRVGECEIVITNQVNGLLVEKSSEDKLSKGIINLIENNELRQHLKKSFKLHVETYYSEKAQIKNIIKVYKSIIKKHIEKL